MPTVATPPTVSEPPDRAAVAGASARRRWLAAGLGFVLGGAFGLTALAAARQLEPGPLGRAGGFGVSVALMLTGGSVMAVAGWPRRRPPAAVPPRPSPAPVAAPPGDRSTVVTGGGGTEPDPDTPDDRVRAAFRSNPRFVLGDRLGAGGCGVVYAATDRRADRPVVLKMIHPHHAGAAELADRFIRETRVGLLLRHEHIVRSLDELHVGGMRVLVLERITGEDLDRLVERDGPLPPARAARYLRQAALGLEYAHTVHRLVHRDVKPSNLMLATDRDQVKVLDFGLVKVTDPPPEDKASLLSGTFGTPLYMAPEQAEDSRRVDHRADIYSLGCTGYHLLAGRPPFTGDNPMQVLMAHRVRAVPPVHAARPDVPAGLSAVVERMMAKDPDDRFQSAAEVAAALEPFAG